MTTASSEVSLSISSCTRDVTFARPDPGITLPLTSESFPRKFEISRAQPYAQRSPCSLVTCQVTLKF
jgi:hypothetical protein